MSSPTPSTDEVLAMLKPSRVILPIFIGLAVVAYLMVRNIDATTFRAIDWKSISFWFWMGAGIILVMLRHFFLMVRIKKLTDDKMNWRQTFEVISLWEFGSAATPSTVGGTAIAFFLLAKENIKAGTSIAVILFTMVLDGIFFLCIIPFLWLVLGRDFLAPALDAGAGGAVWLTLFFAAFGFIIGYSLLLAYGLFVKPHSFKWILVKATSLPFLWRWREKAKQIGDDTVVASKELRYKKRDFWLAGLGSTFAIWTIRFLILNCVVAAVLSVSDHLLLFGRQLLIYALMLLPITPGGSGLAEASFNAFLNDFFTNAQPGIWVVVALLWRLISYYSYLALGVIIFPNWLRRVLKQDEKMDTTDS